MTHTLPKFAAGQTVWHPCSGVGVVTDVVSTRTSRWRYCVAWQGQPGLSSVESDWTGLRCATADEIEVALLLVELRLDAIT